MKKADFSDLGQRLGISPVMARVLVNRGFATAEEQEYYLYGTLDSIPDSNLMLGMEPAVRILQEKLKEKRHIRIMSDYDVDGVTSAYILYKGLLRLDGEVSIDIPDRIRDGYGMNVRMVDLASEEGVDTIVTSDNGIACNEAVDRAKELGMTVIVTDHHQVQDKLPAADVVIDPWQEACQYPFNNICGAEAVYKLIRELSLAEGKPLGSTDFLEFVALGTVCDIMPLIQENRILVREGLRVMLQTENVGLRALLEVTGIMAKGVVTAGNLGYVIGPCINAEGRLSSAKEAMKLLLCTDPEEAKRMAEEVKELNESRKQSTQDGADRALEIIEDQGMAERDHILLVEVPELHESLAGIVASRIKEAYYRPTIVFAKSSEDETLLKGSARSIEPYNMFKALQSAEQHIVHFGGHPMAAGLTIRREELEPLRSRMNEQETLTEDELVEKVYIDVPMPLSYVTLELAKQLEQLEPFGNKNPKPHFGESGLQLEEIKTLGDGALAVLSFRDKRGQLVKAKLFRPESFMESIKMWSDVNNCVKINKYPKLDIIYSVGVNRFRGEESAECIVEDFRKTEA